MIRLPPFRYVAARSIADVCKALADAGPEAMVLGGGTDLVPNMKRRQQMPRVLIGLSRVEELARREERADSIVLGAGTTLADIVRDSKVRETHGALWRAAAQVATPLIRSKATLGGNLCLDTRCNYYNQSLEWRRAIDYCMKAPSKSAGVYAAGEVESKHDGEERGSICWVAPGSPRCWAVSSSDTAPALIALGAEIELVSASGSRRITLDALYHDDGMAYLTKRPDEIVARVIVPRAAGWRSTYWKLRRRQSFDFPVLAAGVAVRFGTNNVVEDARIVLGAIASRPRVVDTKALIGQPLDDARINVCVDQAFRTAKPLDNTDFGLGWRKTTTRAMVSGALRELRGDDMATLGSFARRMSVAPMLPFAR